MKDQIAKDLDLLAKARLERDAISDEMDDLIGDAIPPEVRMKIDAIEAEFGTKIDTLSENIFKIETDIKGRVLQVGETVSGSVLKAVFNKGRISWDTKALDGYVKAHPELLEFRKQGDPYISIR